MAQLKNTTVNDTLTVMGDLIIGNTNIIDIFYPVGAVYISYENVSPSSFMGGSWQSISGVFPRFDTNISSGGSDTHTLTTSEMPSHTHVQDAHNHTQNAHNHTQNQHRHYSFSREATRYLADAFANGADSGYQNDGDGSDRPVTTYTTATNVAQTATNNAQTATNQNTGGGGAHNNMPKYQNMYAWRRTA